ncbi:site-specific integrase [Candidatus Stoquefichus massiliensis]|uniref:site-specific integrase n=1 Tax=Candidatus Stoquefichus massiliensis TaxID=1470350 RepID=UPI00048173AF|nr:site-specific integrase [Candidatus Stoquefichus massiliensis]
MSITERKLKNGKVVYDNAFMYKGTRYKKGGFKTKGQAENWEIEVKYEVNKNGSFHIETKKTFADVYTEWFELHKDEYAINTIKNYQSSYAKIKCHKIAKMKISTINYTIIQTYFNELSKKYEYGTCKNVLKIFNAVFKHAIRSNYLQTNHMPYVILKKDEHKNNDQGKTISYEDFITICNEFVGCHDIFNNRAMVIALKIGYYTGARVSEVLALSKNDIDFENNTINFDKRLDNRSKAGESFTTKMKTKSSYAIVPLAEPLKDVLLEWFQENPYDNICVYEDGNYIEYAWLQKKIQNVSKKLNIPFHFHMLRHTFATTLVTNGISPEIAKKLLRHSSIKTTMDLYTHIDIDVEKQALDSVFSSQLPQNYTKRDLLS